MVEASSPSRSTLLGAGTAVAAILFSAGVVRQSPQRMSVAPSVSRGLQEAQPIVLEDPQEQLNHIRDAISTNEVMAQHLDRIPFAVDALEGKHEDVLADPLVRAASWLVTKDAMNQQDLLVDRFSLAAFYYSSAGANWTDSTNWLSDTHHCDGWYGVTCCKSMIHVPTCAGTADPNEVFEIDLYQNNVAGELSDAFALLQDLRSIYLSKNSIGGTIPGPALSSLPKLVHIYLAHNKLTGVVPSTLRSNGILDALFLQGNDLTGPYPIRSDMCHDDIDYLGVDCEEVECPQFCCRDWKNCFYGND